MRNIGLVFALMTTCIAAYGSDLRRETNEYFKGSIGGKYEFKMVISNENNSCSGSYFYTNHKKVIFLNGVCDHTKFELSEQNEKISYNRKAKLNKFIGSRNGDKVDGIWKSHDGKRLLKFEAIRITPNKKETLEDAKGEYHLSHISGFHGANTMTDIYKEGGKWKAGGSSISGGMREGFSVGLNKNERDILSSLKLVVDASLGVSIYSRNRIAASFPFTQESSFNVVGIKKEEDGINRIYKYNEVGSFIENNLHIATTDKYSFSEILIFENTPIDEAHAISLDYNPVNLGFEVHVIDKHCCGGTTLYFKK